MRQTTEQNADDSLTLAACALVRFSDNQPHRQQPGYGYFYGYEHQTRKKISGTWKKKPFLDSF